MELKKIILILILMLSIAQVHGKSCGGDIECNCLDTITTNHILEKDLYCKGNGLYLEKNLNCNNHSIIGSGEGIGLIITGKNYIKIENCNINNFTKGIEIKKNQNNFAMHNTIKDSFISNNSIGIHLIESNENNIHNNIIKNNKIYGIYDQSNSGIIWNNTFYKTGIYYTDTKGKKYELNGIENKYLNNATGPKKDCIILYDGITINSNVKICNNKYNIFDGIKIDSYSSLDCQKSILMGNNENIGIKISQAWNSNVKNCIIENFSTGIIIDGIYKQNGYSNSYYTKLSNNKIQNNTIGILNRYGSETEINNNIFQNNKEKSLHIERYGVYTQNNTFMNFSPTHLESKGLEFVDNIYLQNSGPNNCIIPQNNMIINSNVRFCKGQYYVPNGLKFLEGSEIDCNGAKLIGNKQNPAINILGNRNTIIKNCIITNFTHGLYYDGIYQNTRTIVSYNNKVENITTYDVIFGIKNTRYGITEKITDSILISEEESILNEHKYAIDATNNWWGTIDNKEIEGKFQNKENIRFLPIKKDSTKSDLEITNISIENQKINMNIKSTNLLPLKNVKLDVIKIKNNLAVKKTINLPYIIHKDNNVELTIEEDLENIILLIDPENEIIEINENNNHKSFKPTIKNIKIIVNTGNFILDNEIRKLLEKQQFNTNISHEIIVGNKIRNPYEELKKITLTKKPYEGKIISNKTHTIITGEDIEGYIITVKKFLKNKDEIIKKNTNIIIDEKNIEAIGIYDFLHNINNAAYYKTNTIKFQEIIYKALNNLMNNEKYFNINIEDTNSTFIIKKLSSEKSQKYKDYLNNNIPLVMAGGLWSNINSWNKLGEELSNEGYDIYLIELTGNKNNECSTCYNYDYEYLTNIVFPSYTNTILRLENTSKLNYIGHSNGARVAIDSISENNLSNKFNIIIAVGMPGAFEELSYFARIINESGDVAIERLEKKNITHITNSRLAHELNSIKGEIASTILKISGFFDGKLFYDNKISLNLFKQYYKWINSNEDSQPGHNVNVNSFVLLYGNFLNQNNDIIVPQVDQIEIFKNIEAKNKIIEEYNVAHTSMTENKNIKNKIKEVLKNGN